MNFHPFARVRAFMGSPSLPRPSANVPSEMKSALSEDIISNIVTYLDARSLGSCKLIDHCWSTKAVNTEMKNARSSLIEAVRAIDLKFRVSQGLDFDPGSDPVSGKLEIIMSKIPILKMNGQILPASFKAVIISKLLGLERDEFRQVTKVSGAKFPWLLWDCISEARALITIKEIDGFEGAHPLGYPINKAITQIVNDLVGVGQFETAEEFLVSVRPDAKRDIDLGSAFKIIIVGMAEKGLIREALLKIDGYIEEKKIDAKEKPEVQYFVFKQILRLKKNKNYMKQALQLANDIPDKKTREKALEFHKKHVAEHAGLMFPQK